MSIKSTPIYNRARQGDDRRLLVRVAGGVIAFVGVAWVFHAAGKCVCAELHHAERRRRTGKVLPSPNAMLVLAPMSGLMNREAGFEPFCDSVPNPRRNQNDAIPMSEPFANDRRVIDRLFGRWMFFIVTPFSSCQCHLAVSIRLANIASRALTGLNESMLFDLQMF